MATDEEILAHDFTNLGLFVSSPMFGGNCHGIFHRSALELQRLCIQVGLKAAFSDLWQEGLITRARNIEVDKFRSEEVFTHHLFIDSDQGFRPGDILQMLMADKDILTAPVAKKGFNWKQIEKAVKLGYPATALDQFTSDLAMNTIEPIKIDGTPQAVGDGGTGIMMVKRHVYDKMQAAYPEIEYVPMLDEACNYGDGQHMYAFFDTMIDPETRYYLSEDYAFCHRWRKLGGDVCTLAHIVTQHMGIYMYVGNAPAIAAVQNDRRPLVVDENDTLLRDESGRVLAAVER